MKKKSGISIDKALADELTNTVKALRDLRVSRSELVETILADYFKVQPDPVGKARELVVFKRKEKI